MQINKNPSACGTLLSASVDSLRRCVCVYVCVCVWLVTQKIKLFVDVNVNVYVCVIDVTQMIKLFVDVNVHACAGVTQKIMV